MRPMDPYLFTSGTFFFLYVAPFLHKMLIVVFSPNPYGLAQDRETDNDLCN